MISLKFFVAFKFNIGAVGWCVAHTAEEHGWLNNTIIENISRVT